MEEEHFIKKKCKRYNIPGNAHVLTFSCYRNQKFLLSQRTCQWLIESIEKAREKHQFSLWAFVFMPDHVHLLIQPFEKQYNISNILKDIKAAPARKAVNPTTNHFLISKGLKRAFVILPHARDNGSIYAMFMIPPFNGNGFLFSFLFLFLFFFPHAARTIELFNTFNHLINNTIKARFSFMEIVKIHLDY